MKFWIFLSLVSLNFACVAKIKMDVLYESLCPDSIKFISKQLGPLYNEFKEHLEINFVPFGKSASPQTSGNAEWTCQHGPDECLGNRIQTCMLGQFPNDQDMQMQYLTCQMQEGADRTHRACVESFGYVYDSMLECAESEWAYMQQLSFEQLSTPALIKTNWVPTVLYNGKITKDSHTGKSPILRNVLCEFKFIYNTTPGCRRKSNNIRTNNMLRAKSAREAKKFKSSFDFDFNF